MEDARGSTEFQYRYMRNKNITLHQNPFKTVCLCDENYTITQTTSNGICVGENFFAPPANPHSPPPHSFSKK